MGICNCWLNYGFLPGFIPYLLCGNTPTFWLQTAYSLFNVCGRCCSTFCHRFERCLPLLTALMAAIFASALLLARTDDKGGLSMQMAAGAGVSLFSFLNGYIEAMVFLVPGRTVSAVGGRRELALQLVG